MTFDVYKKATTINTQTSFVFNWHARNGAIFRLTPPWAPLKMIDKKGVGIDKGVKVIFEIKIFGIPMIWEAEHFEYQKNKIFKDRQIRGPFSKWVHTHRFSQIGNGSSIMEDKVEFRLPFGFLSRPFYGFAKRQFERMFHYRHRILKYDMEHHVDKTPPKRFLISGAGGTVGSALVPFLRTCGHKVVRLVRKKGNLLPDELFWDPHNGILDLENTEYFDAVINLNGVDISRGKWTNSRKRKIIASRTHPTRLLVKKITGLEKKPKVFLSSSAVGFYGDRDDHVLTESDENGACFIAKVCRRWENQSQAAVSAGIRTVQLRIGIVLTPAGGALARMELPFKMGCGVRVGNGRQYMSWISMDDLLSSILFIVNTPEIKGPVNLTAPNPVTNTVFSKKLAGVFSKKVFFVLPKLVAKVLWGQMGKETLLASARVKPEKLLNHGFQFQHETLLPALKDLLGRQD
ncbi:MAG: TIGR01777 family oxidoreductase [Desulfobacula sp.]|nr:TIGR01777 family oxidoreductase [Desulfobacula sp.]